MKRAIAIALLAGVTLSGNASAGEFRIGADFGQARGNTGTSYLNDQLASRGLNATASSSDTTRPAWQVSFGYEATPNWGVEAAYVDLGEVKTTFSGTAMDIDAFLAASGGVHPNTAQGVRLSGVYRQVIGTVPDLYATARLGVFSWESSYTLHGPTVSHRVDERGNDLTYGLGLEMGLARLGLPSGLAAHIGWDRYSVARESIDLLSFGLAYRF